MQNVDYSNLEQIIIILFFVIFALGFSALNTTVFYRVANNIPFGAYGKKFRPSCENCGYILKPLDYAPLINWLVHKGKCRNCKTKIDITYFHVELFSFVIFMSVFFLFKCLLDDRLVIVLACLNFLLITFFVEKKHQKIPEKLFLLIFITGIIFRILKDAQLFYLIFSAGFSILFTFFALKKIVEKKYTFPLYYYQLIAISGIYLSIIEYFILLVVSVVFYMLLKLIRINLNLTSITLVFLGILIINASSNI